MARYIDAEKVEKWFHRDDWGTPDARWRPEEEFGKMIDSMPTEDVAPVKYGHWENEYYDPETDSFFHICSCCHRETINYGDKNFCPVCGAKMDGKEDEQ